MILESKNVALGYDGKKVLENINFKIQDNNYLCIIGENGAGKSTLIKGLLGLLKPISGKFILTGIKQNEIGYLSQQNNILKDFPASVYEVVLSGCLNSKGLKPFYSKKDKDKVLENLKKLNIINLKDKYYKDLSGGQKQKVLLARALCSSKKLLLLDEPITGLDYKSTIDFYKLIKKINTNENMCIIMISHDIDSAIEYADLILHLNKDKNFFGTTEEYIKSSNHNCIYGGNNE